MNEKCPIHDNEHPAYLCPDKSNLTGQAQGRWEAWSYPPEEDDDEPEHVVRDEGTHKVVCIVFTGSEARRIAEAHNLALEARLSQALEENERLRAIEKQYDDLCSWWDYDKGTLSFEGLMAERDAALEAARVAEGKAALADEMLTDENRWLYEESWTCSFCQAERELAAEMVHKEGCIIARYDAIPAADAAGGGKG